MGEGIFQLSGFRDNLSSHKKKTPIRRSFLQCFSKIYDSDSGADPSHTPSLLANITSYSAVVKLRSLRSLATFGQAFVEQKLIVSRGQNIRKTLWYRFDL